MANAAVGGGLRVTRTLGADDGGGTVLVLLVLEEATGVVEDVLFTSGGAVEPNGD